MPTHLHRARPDTFEWRLAGTYLSHNGNRPCWEVHSVDNGFRVLKVWRDPDDLRELSSVQLPTTETYGQTFDEKGTAIDYARFHAATKIAKRVHDSVPMWIIAPEYGWACPDCDGIHTGHEFLVDDDGNAVCPERQTVDLEDFTNG